MNKANVALDLQPCCGKRSGIGTYTYELAKRLQDTDDISFRGNIFDFRNRNDVSESLQGITMPVERCTAVPSRVYRALPPLFVIPRKFLFQKVDLSLFFNYVVPHRISGKVAVAIHDMTYVRFPETVHTRGLINLRMNVKRSVEKADHIITLSEFSKREIHEILQAPLDKISIIPPAPSICEEIAQVETIRSKFHINKPYLLFVGNIEPRKNLTRLLRAFDLLKREQGIPHQLVLAGGQGWNNEDIHATVNTLDCKEDICFTGYVSAAEKNTFYKHADVFVFPSLYEGFGIPPLEAMYFGCPVVSSNAASLPEVCGDAAEFVDAYSVTSIAEGVWRVISDKQRAEKLIEKGYTRSKGYTWEDSAQRLTDLCQEILEN